MPARAWRDVGEMLKGRQGLLKGLGRLPQGRALDRPGPGLATVGHSFVHLATQSMVRQPVDLLGLAVGIQPLEGCHNADMEPPPLLLQERLIGHLVGEGMLESILPLGKAARLIQELDRLEVRETPIQGVVGQLSDGLQQRQGHVHADDRGGLEGRFSSGGN